MYFRVYIYNSKIKVFPVNSLTIVHCVHVVWSVLVCQYTAYISSPQQNDEDKKERVLCALVVQEEDAVEKLVECLAGDNAHSTHRYMGRQLRKAMEKKKQHPECELHICA